MDDVWIFILIPVAFMLPLVFFKGCDSYEVKTCVESGATYIECKKIVEGDNGKD